MKVASVLILIAAWLLPQSAVARPVRVRRLAIVVGNNVGAKGDLRLHYAQRDAKRVAQTFRELGSVKRSDLFLLLDKDAATLRRVFDRVDRIAAKEKMPTSVLFYYSGHADQKALHLGHTTLSWNELRERLKSGSAGLRLGLVDACHAGGLTQAKGFSLGKSFDTAQTATGSALLVAAEATEMAQESESLKGSFFTHFLVSGLRGAADVNQDKRVTLSEIRTYTTEKTRSSTASWARAVQHPVYHFDIKGRADVVLTDLREGDAHIELASQLSGRVVITERNSKLVILETDKTRGRTLTLALPRGRYVVHLRQARRVQLAEVTLPWGGKKTVTARDLTQHSYQQVAQKGGIVELRRHSLRVGTRVSSALIGGMGVLPSLNLAYGVKFSRVELGLGLSVANKSFATVDARTRNTILGGRASVAYEYPSATVDIRVWFAAEMLWWRQDVAMQATRTARVPGTNAGIGVRLPLTHRLFAELSIEGSLLFPDVDSKGRVAQPSVNGGLWVGTVF